MQNCRQSFTITFPETNVETDPVFRAIKQLMNEKFSEMIESVRRIEVQQNVIMVKLQHLESVVTAKTDSTTSHKRKADDTPAISLTGVPIAPKPAKLTKVATTEGMRLPLVLKPSPTQPQTAEEGVSEQKQQQQQEEIGVVVTAANDPQSQPQTTQRCAHTPIVIWDTEDIAGDKEELSTSSSSNAGGIIRVGGDSNVLLPYWTYVRCLETTRGTPDDLGSRLCLRLMQALFSREYMITHNYSGSNGKDPIDKKILDAVQTQAVLQFGSDSFFTEPNQLSKHRDYINNSFRVVAYRQRRGLPLGNPFWDAEGLPLHECCTLNNPEIIIKDTTSTCDIKTNDSTQ